MWFGNPYRSPQKEPLCQHTKKCCGTCHAAVGGCLIGVEFKVRGQTIPAGASMDRPGGTGALVWCATHGRWERPPEDRRG